MGDRWIEKWFGFDNSLIIKIILYFMLGREGRKKRHVFEKDVFVQFRGTFFLIFWTVESDIEKRPEILKWFVFKADFRLLTNSDGSGIVYRQGKQAPEQWPASIDIGKIVIKLNVLSQCIGCAEGQV